MPKLSNMALQAFVKNTSTKPGVYIMYDSKDTVIYIGKAKNLRNRLKSYFAREHDNEKIAQLILNLARIEVTITPTEVDALLVEISLIKQHKPRYNIQFKDSKGYPYIFIDTSHPYPRLFVSRERKHLNKMNYFGPYPNSKAMYFTVNHLYKIFKLRDCKDSYFNNRSRPCLRYQIGRCHAPCTGLISSNNYLGYVNLAIKLLNGKNQDVLEELRCKMNNYSNDREYNKAKEYRDLINFVQILLNKQIVSNSKGNCDFIALVSKYGYVCIHIIQIRNDEIVDSKTIIPSQTHEFTNEEILSKFLANHYLNIEHKLIPSAIFINLEIFNQDLLLLSQAISKIATKKVTFACPSQGKRKELLDICIFSAREALDQKIKISDFYSRGFVDLQELLELKRVPNLIECFDVSHFKGEATLASCVVFTMEGASKASYRHYRLKEINTGDDYKALGLVIKKRYSKIIQLGSKLPDIIIVDGGIGQMSSVLAVLNKLELETIPVLAIAKGKERKPGLEKIYYSGSKSQVEINNNSCIFKMLQNIRDESHKHAISYNRKLLRKKRTTSILEQIEGIGLQKRKNLLEHFGGIQGVSNAGISDLAKVKGVGIRLAKIIFSTIHPD